MTQQQLSRLPVLDWTRTRNGSGICFVRVETHLFHRGPQYPFREGVNNKIPIVCRAQVMALAGGVGAKRGRKEAKTHDFIVNASDPPLVRGILERALPDFATCIHEMENDPFKAFYDFALKQRNFDRIVEYVIANDEGVKQLEVCPWISQPLFFRSPGRPSSLFSDGAYR